MLISRSVGPTGARPRRHSWFDDPAASGGILFELGSHDIDLQQALAGPAESVQALSRPGRWARAVARWTTRWRCWCDTRAAGWG